MKNQAATTLPNSLWAASAPSFQADALQGDHSCDVVVIGAGFTGLACALELADQQTSVIVLESHQVGFGGSGRNVGLVNAGLWLEPDKVNARLGDDYGNRLYQELSTSPSRVFSLIDRHGIECEAQRSGTLHLAPNACGLKELDRRAEQLASRGAPIERLGSDKTVELTGSGYYKGAIFDPRAGTIQPLAYVRGLAKAAISAGAAVYERSPVVSAAQHNDQWRVATPGGTVTAERVVVATNGYSAGLIPSMPASFVPINFFQCATQPLDKALLKRILPQKQGCWDTGLVMTSLRLDQAGRLIIGSVGEIHDGAQSGFLTAWANSMLKKFYPFLAPQPWSYCWSGRIAYSSDQVPHLHQLAPGMITTLGYSGRGIGPGTAMGTWMAKYLMGTPIESLPLPVTAVQSIKTRKIQALYYARGSDLYHIGQRLA
jgi:glycine/D-amino acid oxidase-like deaminating enzyme